MPTFVVVLSHAAPNGKTEAFARKVMEWGKPVFTFGSPANANLLALGARAVTPENVLGRPRHMACGPGGLDMLQSSQPSGGLL